MKQHRSKLLMSILLLLWINTLAVAQESSASAGETIGQLAKVNTGDLKLKRNYIFGFFPAIAPVYKPITEHCCQPGYSFDREVDNACDLFLMPSGYQPGMMMSVVNQYSNLGKMTFSCKYFFDDEGQLIDHETSFSKHR